MAYKPDNLGAMAQPITMNKADIAQQEKDYTLEDNQRYLQQTKENLDAMKYVGTSSVKQGVAMGKAKWYSMQIWGTEKELERKRDMLRTRLSQLSGVALEDITPEKEEELLSMYSEDKPLQIWNRVIERQQDFYDKSQQKIDSVMGYYNYIEEEQLRMIDNMNGGILKKTLPFAGDVITGLTDWTNAAKQVCIGVLVGLASPSIAAGATAVGLGKVGTLVAKKSMEYGLNAVDNYFTMEQEHELINPNADPLTTQEKIYGTVVGAVVDIGIDGGVYALKKGAKGLGLIRGTEEIDKVVKNKALPDDNIPLENTSTKEIAKQVYDVEHGVNSANEDLFRMKVSDNPDMVYNYALDPQNPHYDIYDNVFNDTIQGDNSIYYKFDDDGVKKYNVDKDRIVPTENQYKYIIGDAEINNLDMEILDTDTTKYKIDNSISIDEQIPPTYKIEKSTNLDDVNIYSVDESSSKYIVSSNYAMAEKALRQSENGSFAKVINGNETIIIFRDGDNIVKIIQDTSYVNRPVKNKKGILTDHFFVRRLKDNLNSRVEIIDANGNFKNINGMAKEAYIGRYKQLTLINDTTRIINVLAEDIKNNKIQIDDNTFEVNGELGRTITDICDSLFMSKIQHTQTNIVSHNFKEFKRLMKDPDTGKVFFANIDDMLEHTDRGALAEFFVNGKTTKKIFDKNFDDEELVARQLEKWVNGLIDNNTFIVGYKNRMNIDIDMSLQENIDKYGHILKFDKEGNLQYNTDKGAFFDGMTEDEIGYKILDMFINPEKIDLGNEKAINDRNTLYKIFEDFTADRQNAVATKRVFDKNNVNTDILSEFGIIKTNEVGDLVVSLSDFVQGLSNIIKEISNPETSYNVDELKNVLQTFNKFEGLPKKYIPDQDGDIAINLLDFIINNKNNTMMDMKEFHNILTPIINDLDDNIESKINKIIPLMEQKDIDLQIDKIDKGNIDKVITILNRWKEKISKENGANDYLSTQQYKDELIKVQELSGRINIDNENITNIVDLENIKEVQYTGDVTFENISEKLSPIIDKTNDSVQIDTLIRDKVDEVRNIVGRKRNIETIVSADDFKNKIDNIANDLRQQGVAEDIINKLYSTNHKELKSGIKEVEDFLYNNNKKRNTFLNNIEELEELTTPEDIKNYIKTTRNRKKVNSILDTMEEFGANKDIVNDIRDFINYNGKEFDYKLDKDTIIKNIDNVLNSANNFKEQLDVEDYGKRRNAYQKLYSRYNQIRSLIKDKTPKNSVAFLNSKDIEKIYKDILEYSKIVGENPEDIIEYQSILTTLQKTLNGIQDSRKNSPLKKLNKALFDGYKAITSKERQKFGRLETVINKRRWFEDKRWYTQTQGIGDNQLEIPRVMKILFEDFKDISEIPEGIAEKYIDPEKMNMFKKLYEYSKNKFRGNEIFDDSGNLIQSTPLTLDQFSVVYAKFLEELSDTTSANKKQSIEALKVFFNDADDMIDFFTNRKNDYGVDYVKNNRNILRVYNEDNALAMADIEVLGMDRRTFANKLNFNNKDVQWGLKRNTLEVTDTIEKQFKNGDGTYLQEKTLRKDINTETKNVTKAISDYLKRTKDRDYFYDGLKNTVSNSYEKFIYNTLDLLYPIVLNCTGLMEQMFNPMFAFRRTSWVDAKGKMFGYKSSNRLIGNAKMYGSTVGQGILQGAISISNMVTNGALGVVNAISTLDRYFLSQNLINRMLDKNIDLRVHGTGINTATKMLARVTGTDEAIVDSLFDMYTTKKTLKGKIDYVQPKDLPFRGNKANYIKTAFSEAFDAFKDQAMNMQEVADMSRGIFSSIRARNLMEEFLTKSYIDLPESIVATLRNFGITENNYQNFTNTLKNISPDGQTFKGVYLMDLMGQIPNSENGMTTGISKILQAQDIDMVGAVQNLTNYFYDNAFVLDKKLKYSAKGEGAINRLAFALRHTTIGIGLEDISRLTNEKTASGLYKSKISRFNKIDNKLDVVKNMIVNGATTLPFFLMSSVILSQGGNLLDDVLKKPEKTKQDLADSMTRWSIFKNRIIQDENLAKGTFKGLSYLALNVFPTSVGNALPINSLVSGGNVLDIIKPYMADGYLAIQKLTHQPTTVDIKNVNATLRALSPDVKYDEVEHMNEGRIMPIANLFTSIAFVRSFGKVPANWYRAWTTKGDKTLENKKRNSFINKGATEEWKRAAALQWDKIYSENEMSIQVNIDDENNPQEKYANLPDDTLVPIPDNWEDLNEEGQEAIGEYVFDILNSMQEEVLPMEYGANINKINAINEWGRKNELIDEDKYNRTKENIYKDMKLDDIIKELPAQYRIAIKTIEKNIGDMNNIQKEELHLKLLQDINNGAEAYDLIKQYNKPEQQSYTPNIINKQKNYKTIDEIPSQYKIYYKIMKKQGYDITEEDILTLANQDAPIPKIPE